MNLVTGATGHIGNVLARELGFQPRPARQAIVDAVRWFQQRPAVDGTQPAASPEAAA
jgi:hypothetical protein